MKRSTKLLILGSTTLLFIMVLAAMQPIPQPAAYHLFADHRTCLGVINCWNVLSNLPFLFIGLYGLWQVKKSAAPVTVQYMYAILFTGIVLTGLGSAYYHHAPDNDSLVFDRLPMTIVFMSFFAATIAAWINRKAGTLLLLPLLMLGIGSVLWWHYTEQAGQGDLRSYAFVQFYPMLIIPLIFFLFASPANNKGLYLLIGVMVWYGLAKLFEVLDAPVYNILKFVSGHSLKHIAAAVATWYIVLFYIRKYKPYNFSRQL
jgi:hypothetical protein